VFETPATKDVAAPLDRNGGLRDRVGERLRDGRTCGMRQGLETDGADGLALVGPYVGPDGGMARTR
jgi:hypothetical protein